MNWRSPPMVPRPIDPASVTPPTDPAQRLALGAAWRLRAFAHALAHGLRRVPATHHRVVARRIDACLAASDAFRDAPALAACGEDPERLVQARLVQEPLPYCESWAEAAMADVLFAGALDAALGSLVGSSDAALAAAARLDRGARFGEGVLDELAADPPNRACLQILVERWLASCVRAVGKPGTDGDAALVSTGVKTAPAGTTLLAWLEHAEQRVEPWGLCLPDAQFMGVDVPGDWAPRRRARRMA